MSVLQSARRAAARIEAAHGLNAVVSFDRDILLEQASAVDRGGSAGPVRGLIIGIKDNICTLEHPTTCASRILAGYRSPFEATAVLRLKAAGALVACKTNLDEFAMGSSTEHSAFGRARHPERADLVPGGSSGGSVALTAVGAVDAALGSETGGSVRQPAAFCGVVGLTPTYGRVSRYGLVAFGSSLDQIAVTARTVETAAHVLSVISGRDVQDATSADADPVATDGMSAGVAGLTVGLPTEYFNELDAGVRRACHHAIDCLRNAGAVIREVSLPHTHLALPAYYVIAPAEASSNLARYDGVRYGLRVTPEDGDVHAMYRATRGAGFGPEVRRRIVIGTYVLSAGYYDAYYRKAVAARTLVAKDFQDAFASGIDLLFAPTTPSTAFKAGDKLTNPVAMYRSDVFVCPTNLARLPAISVPIGRTGGLPVGAQFIAPAFEETRMIGAAAWLTSVVDAQQEVS